MLFQKSLIGTSPQSPGELTYSSPFPTLFLPTMTSEGKGPLAKPFQGKGRRGLPSKLAKDFEKPS